MRPARREAPVALDERVDGQFAIRRQVVSLPPVIVIIPLEVSYSSALREMSTDLRVSPAGDQRPYAGERAGQSSGATLVCEESIDGVEQVRDVARIRAHVVEIALVVVVGGPDQAA